jgi:hypothetical protein
MKTTPVYINNNKINLDVLVSIFVFNLEILLSCRRLPSRCCTRMLLIYGRHEPLNEVACIQNHNKGKYTKWVSSEITQLLVDIVL